MEINGSSEQVDKRWVYDMMEALVLFQSSFSWHTTYSFTTWFLNFCLVYASLEGSLEHVHIRSSKKLKLSMWKICGAILNVVSWLILRYPQIKVVQTIFFNLTLQNKMLIFSSTFNLYHSARSLTINAIRSISGQRNKRYIMCFYFVANY